jgi:hypothetical protein
MCVGRALRNDRRRDGPARLVQFCAAAADAVHMEAHFGALTFLFVN